jgi:hypothetical protein
MNILMKSITSDIKLRRKRDLSSEADTISVNSGVKTQENWKRKKYTFVILCYATLFSHRIHRRFEGTLLTFWVEM